MVNLKYILSGSSLSIPGFGGMVIFTIFFYVSLSLLTFSKGERLSKSADLEQTQCLKIVTIDEYLPF